MELKEALELISDGHSIYAPEYAEEICSAFGVPFDRKHLVQSWHGDPPGTFKGLTMSPENEGAEGVYSLTLSYHVAAKLGLGHPGAEFIGRGSQAQANARAVKERLALTQ